MKVWHLFPFKSISLLFLLLFINSSCHQPSNSKQFSEPISIWEKIGPGGGGSTFNPVFSYHSPSTFLVRCDMTGSYLTSNGGNSYQQINFANGTSGYAFDPKNPKIIYVGSASLFRSVDGGKQWELIFPKKQEINQERFQGDHAVFSIETANQSLYNIPGSDKSIRNIRIDPTNNEKIYFSMGRFFFYSMDYGKTWSREELDLPIDYIYTNSNSLKEEVYIFSSQAMYIFNKSTLLFKKQDIPVAMAPAFSFSGGTLSNGKQLVFYALHQDTSQPMQEEFGHTQIWVSKDGGQTWKPVQNSLITNEKTQKTPSYTMIACSEFEAQHAYVVCNRFEEKREDGSFAHWYGAIKTDNMGEDWQWVWKGGGGSGQYGVKDGVGILNLKDAWVEKAFGGEYIRLLDVGVSPSDGKVAIVTDWYRTMKTLDGGKTWNEIYSERQPDTSFKSRGMDVTTTYGVHFDPFDSAHIAISYTDIGFHHSYNGGKSWTRSVEGVPAQWHNTCYWIAFDPKVKGKMWSAWSSLHDFPRGKMTRNPAWKSNAKGGVCISTDGGKTWKPSIKGMGSDSPATSIVIDPNSEPGNRTLYASIFNKGIFKSTDDGKTWQLKNKGIEGNVSAFELTIQENGTLFLTVSPTPMHKNGKKGREIYSGAVYKSTNGANTWTKLNVSKKNLFPNGLDYDPDKPDRLYLACWSGISLSDLVGKEVAESTGGNQWLDMDGGIFLSEDGGKTWSSIFGKDQYVYDVTVDTFHKGRIYCNTFNKAAYRSDDYGKTWNKLKDYDFHWGHRVIIDRNDPEQVYLTTYGSSVWHGTPVVE